MTNLRLAKPFNNHRSQSEIADHHGVVFQVCSQRRAEGVTLVIAMPLQLLVINSRIGR